MIQAAVKQPATQTHSRYHPGRQLAPEERFGAPVAFSNAPPSLQRSSACACGGGCPRCQHGKFLFQPKLKIGATDDKYEREADHIADMVMRMPEPGLQRKPT